MRSSSILCVLGAALVAASPVHNKLHKKAIEWEVVTDTVYVTVTAGESGKGPIFIQKTVLVEPIMAPTTTSSSSTSSTPPPPPPTTTSTTPPPPPPTTTSTPPPPPPVTTKKAAASPVVVQAKPKPSSVAAPASAAPAGFADKAVYYHNQHRANHSAPAVTWDAELAKYAATTAATCHFAHDMNQGSGHYGQNINARGSSANIKNWDAAAVVADSITNGWYYSEVQNFADYYNIANPPTGGPEFLHFTQVVWKGTTTIGCHSQYCKAGTVFAGSNSWFTVCNYGPAGNMGGQYAVDVGKPINAATLKAAIPS